MAETIDLDLDPQKIIKALNDMSEETKKLASEIEDSLGKKAVKDINKLEEEANKGSSKIASYFRDLGKRVKEDLKTAFDFGKVLAGFNIANTLGQGVKEVFNLEKAFDRLNTRLQFTGKQFQDFKKTVGEKISMTGQKMEDIFPGIEQAAAKGGVRSPEQLSAIGEMLAKAKAVTGEETGGLAENIIEILKSQGKDITSQTFKETLDALQAARVKGAFKTAGEAGAAVSGIAGALSPEQQKQMGLGTREMGGLAAMASKAGAAGPEVLQHILKMGTQAGGRQLLNSIFGDLFDKSGKMNVNAFKKIDKKRFGEFSEQTLAAATGTDQAELSRFIDAMKGNMSDFNDVVKGANETANQFGTASDNLATKVDQFKQGAVDAGRGVADSLSTATNEILKGHGAKALEALSGAKEAVGAHKGAVAGALGLSAAGLILGGSGLKGLLGKAGGAGGLAAGMIGGEAAKAAGVQPVYVVNAAEIGAGGGGGGVASALGGLGGKLGKLGKFAGIAGGVLSAGTAAYGAYEAVTTPGVTGGAKGEAYGGAAGTAIGGAIGLAFGGVGAPIGAMIGDEVGKVVGKYIGDAMDPAKIHEAVASGTAAGNEKGEKKPAAPLTNPSDVTGRGGGI